jgi:hypothetical protein
VWRARRGQDSTTLYNVLTMLHPCAFKAEEGVFCFSGTGLMLLAALRKHTGDTNE